MSDTVRKLNISITTNTESAEEGMRRLSGHADNTKSKFKSLDLGVTDLIRSFGALFAIQGAIGVASNSLKLATDAEMMNVQFKVLLGNGDKAKAVLSDLNKFADVTPFEPDQVIKAGRALLAVGTSTEKLMPSLKAIGDVAAGSGKDFNELVNIFAKNKSSNLIQGEDLNQLVEAGIPIMDEFAKRFGITGENAGSKIRDMASKGKIQFKDLEAAFENMSKEGGKYANMMDALSQTTGGKWSTFQGYIKAVEKQFGEFLLLAGKPIIDFFTDSEHGMARVQVTAILLGSAFTAILVPALYNAAIAGWAAMAPYLPFVGIALAMAAAFTVLYLVFEDLFVFLQGGNSVFGNFLKWLDLKPETINSIRNFINTMIDGIKKIASWIWDTLKPAMGWITAFIMGPLLIAFAYIAIMVYPIPLAIMAVVIAIIFMIKYWDEIKIAASIALNWVWDKLKAIGRFILDVAIMAGKGIIMYLFPLTAIYFFWDEIKTFFAWIWSMIEDIPLVKKITAIALQIWQIMKPFVDKLVSIFDGLVRPFILIYEKIKDIMGLGSDKFGFEKGSSESNLAEAFSNAGISDDKIMGKQVKQATLTPIRGTSPKPKAEGGPVEAGVPYMINEKGSEVVTFPANGTITPNSAIGGSSNNSTVVNMQITIQSAGENYDAFTLFEKFKEFMNSPNNQAQARAEMGLSPA